MDLKKLQRSTWGTVARDTSLKEHVIMNGWVDVSGRGTASIEANEVGQGTSKQQRETL
jgi:hypothetical protein